MRIASLRLPQTPPPTIVGSVLQRCNRSTAWRFCPFLHSPRGTATHHKTSSSSQSAPHDDRVRCFSSSAYSSRPEIKQPNCNVKEDAESITPGADSVPDVTPIQNLSHAERQDPDTWVKLLEKYLPKDLRSDQGLQEEHAHRAENSMQSDLMSSEILSILNTGRKTKNAGIDILAYLTFSRGKAGFWICNFLLEKLVSRTPPQSSQMPPSNILWPKQSLNTITLKSINVDTVSHASFEPRDEWEQSSRDPRYSSTMSDVKDKTMDQIWTTLGTIVVWSTKATETEAQRAMNTVKLILGQIHKLNLVPDNVYTYQPSPYSITVQRSPLIHLVSSRILTALSDAAWRDQQQENIEKAASHGLSYKEIGRDPPGGRFRLKVDPMDPEVWVEFILWCCVEGGFANAGLRIINLLRQDIEDPWFAVTWSQSNKPVHSMPQIDWNRARTRNDGTGGRTEGFSKAKPLAEVPPRTVSTEVVLALVEAHIDYVQRVPETNGMLLEAVQNGIEKLLAFLEPHDLSSSYFDYVSVRLMQTEAFSIQGSKMMRRWIDRLTFLRSMKTIQESPPPKISFELDSLLMHSEFTAGFVHQLLESNIRDGNIRDALKTFDDLQKLVDNSKLYAITAFLRTIPSTNRNFFSSHFFTGNADFVDSHGQLPLYKLASLLDLATDTNLIGFGQWLLNSGDPDGPLVPKDAYGEPGIAGALMRFAGMSNDRNLLQDIPISPLGSRRPTVRMLRAIFDAQISLLELEIAGEVLKNLDRAEGGGYGLNNLAHLAATILKLEHDKLPVMGMHKDLSLHNATQLLESILTNDFPGKSGFYKTAARRKFKQQVAILLSMFETFPQSRIAELARTHIGRFRTGNTPNLPPSVFNTFFEAVVEVEGAAYGTEFVGRYCTSVEQTTDALDDLPWDYNCEAEVVSGTDSQTPQDQDVVQRSTSMTPVQISEHTFTPFVSTSDAEDSNLASTNESWEQDDAQRTESAISVSDSQHTFIPFVSDWDVKDKNLALQGAVFARASNEDSDQSQHTFIPFAQERDAEDYSLADNAYGGASGDDTSESQHTFVPFGQNQDTKDPGLNSEDDISAAGLTFTPSTQNRYVDNDSFDSDASEKDMPAVALDADLDSIQLESEDTVSASFEIDSDEANFSSPFFDRDYQTTSQNEGTDNTTHGNFTPVAIFDARTIRIIVRKAKQRKAELEAISASSTDYNNILHWARSKFLELGYSAEVAAHETQISRVEGAKRPVPGNDVDRKPRRRIWRKTHSPSRISKSFQGKFVADQRDGAHDRRHSSASHLPSDNSDASEYATM